MTRRALAIFLAALFLLSSCSGRGWTRADTARQAAIVALQVADWQQTRWIVRHPDGWHETNPFLGDHPSMDRVDTYFPVLILGHAAISYALPPEWRKWWQYGSMAGTGYVVIRNWGMGVRW